MKHVSLLDKNKKKKHLLTAVYTCSFSLHVKKNDLAIQLFKKNIAKIHPLQNASDHVGFLKS